MKLSFSLKTTTIIAFLIVSSFTVTARLSARASAASEWRLSINGLVEHPLDLTVEDLKAMPQTTETATIYCVDFPNQVVATGQWTGVSLATLLEKAGVQPSAVKIAFYANDQYATDLDLITATHGGVIVAYAKDGAPLSETLRLVVPEKWGYKWISQLVTITLVDYDFKGKWESQGYSDDAYIQSTSGTSRTPISQNLPSSEIPAQTSNTTTAPSSSPLASSNSTAVPSQNTQDPEPKLETPTFIPLLTVLEVSAVASAIAVSALLVFAKRHHRLKNST